MLFSCVFAGTQPRIVFASLPSTADRLEDPIRAVTLLESTLQKSIKTNNFNGDYILDTDELYV